METWRVVRMSSWTPSSASSRATPRLTEDFGSRSSRAAAEKLDVRATASKVARRFRSTVAPWERRCVLTQIAPTREHAQDVLVHERDTLLPRERRTHMATNTWDIDVSHSAIHFWAGHVELDEQDLTRSAVDVRIDAASIDTQVADRDTHLRSPDFLDVAKYPELTFRSKVVEKAGDGYRV